MSGYICSVCESDDTEGGDVLCPLCREKFGENQARIDGTISMRANKRALLRSTGNLIIRALTTHKEAAE